MPKRGASERYALGEEQRDALIHACQSLEDKVLIKLCLYAGLRVSEVAHLNAEWVHNTLTGLEISIPESQPCDCSRCKGMWYPKTKTSVRTIPVTTPLLADLQEFLRLSPKGFQKTRQSLWWRLKQVASRAKIHQRGLAYNTTFCHALRATCATILATKGMSAPALSYFMGWKSIEIGQHYINIAQAKDEAQKQARQIMG